MTARVYQSDRALGVTASPGHTVLVFGYFGEPFARLGDAGTAVNAASVTAAGFGLLRGLPRGTGWRLRSRSSTLVWHDRRLRGLPPGVDRKRWTIRLRIDGRPALLSGQLWRVKAWGGWVWLAIALPLALTSAVLLLRRRLPAVRRAAVVFGLASAVAALVTGLALALDSYGSGGKWVEAANVLVFTLVGLGFIVWGSRDAGAIAGGALGLLGLALGLSTFPVLLHGAVLSVLPGMVARLTVLLSISAGAAATVLGLFVFESSFDRWAERDVP